jgi:isopenicillin N synthase-like dioxygenase
MAEAGLPIIDIGPFVEGGRGASSVVDAVNRACVDTGFFVVTGHGVSPEATKRLYDGARAFFDRPEAEKRRLVDAKQDLGGVGFAPLLDEALAATTGVATPGDLKESLNFGPRLAGSPWPAEPAGLSQAFADYFLEMERLAVSLRRIFCAAIGLAPDYFEPSFANHLSALRVINYPAQTEDPLPGQLRAGAHTDYGFMTILRSEASSGGLQVRTRAGDWIDAPSVEGGYVINIADAFMRWTNDAWKSTPHRVVNPPRQARGSARRQSIPFFVNPSKETIIECLPAFCSAARPAKYQPMTYGDYIELKTKQAFTKPAA